MKWPDEFPTPALQRLADAHAMLALERSGLPSIDAWQAQQWRLLHEWLAAHTPWWRERLGSHADWRQPQRWPILRREDMLAMVGQHGAAPVPRHHGALREGSTSGSSGQPVRYFASQFAQRITDHLYYADHQRQGRNPYARRATIDSRTPPHEGTHVDGPPVLELGIGPQLRRRNNQFSMREHAQWLCEQAPAYLATNPDWLEALMDEARDNSWPLPRLEQVLSYGSTVSPGMREKARKQLGGASVRDRYSCEECGPLAFQCPASDDHYHVAVANVRLEVVDDAGQVAAAGQPGRVLVTALHQYATPLVRYDVGDVAALHPTCPGCGEGIAALSHLLGRRRFLIRLPDGELTYVRPIAKNWLACAPVTEHRLVQTTPRELVAEVVLARPITPDEIAAIVAMLGETVSPLLDYRVQQVERIERTASTKRQDVVSLLP